MGGGAKEKWEGAAHGHWWQILTLEASLEGAYALIVRQSSWKRGCGMSGFPGICPCLCFSVVVKFVGKALTTDQKWLSPNAKALLAFSLSFFFLLLLKSLHSLTWDQTSLVLMPWPPPSHLLPLSCSLFSTVIFFFIFLEEIFWPFMFLGWKRESQTIHIWRERKREGERGSSERREEERNTLLGALSRHIVLRYYYAVPPLSYPRSLRKQGTEGRSLEEEKVAHKPALDCACWLGPWPNCSHIVYFYVATSLKNVTTCHGHFPVHYLWFFFYIYWSAIFVQYNAQIFSWWLTTFSLMWPQPIPSMKHSATLVDLSLSLPAFLSVHFLFWFTH